MKKKYSKFIKLPLNVLNHIVLDCTSNQFFNYFQIRSKGGVVSFIFKKFIRVEKCIGIRQLRVSLDLEGINVKEDLTLKLHIVYYFCLLDYITLVIMGSLKLVKGTLILKGVGFKLVRPEYKFQNVFLLSVGLSHTVPIQFAKYLFFNLDNKGRVMKLACYNTVKFQQSLFNIKNYKFPDNYKGKGFRFEGEVILVKPGKRKQH